MIKRLYIHNFRCLENFELPIAEKQSALLIGKNGAGKSTISYALEVLQRIGRGTNQVSQLVKPSDMSIGRQDAPLRFELEVKLDNKLYQYTLVLEYPEGFKELRVLQENLSVDGKFIYSRDTAQVQLAKSGKAKEANFFLNWHLVALPLIQEQYGDPLYIFKIWLARMLILAPIPSLITGDSEGETLTPERTVRDFGEWFSGLIASSPAAYARIDQYLSDMMPDFKDIKNPVSKTDFRSLTVQFQEAQFVISLPFRDLSDGEKCFFICAVVLAANDAYGPIFCFWDEPDNYLAPSEVGHFVMMLRRAFQNGGQLLVTSHNPEAIRQFSGDNTIVLGRKSHLEPTQARILNDLQVTGDLSDALLRGDVNV